MILYLCFIQYNSITLLQDIGRYIYVLVAQPGEWNLLETFSSVKRAQLTYNANANKRTR